MDCNDWPGLLYGRLIEKHLLYEFVIPLHCNCGINDDMNSLRLDAVPLWWHGQDVILHLAHDDAPVDDAHDRLAIDGSVPDLHLHGEWCQPRYSFHDPG